MIYTVMVMAEAEREMGKAYKWLLRRTRQHAPRWYNGLIDAILSLDELPLRCPVAPESRDSPEEIRQLLYGDPPHVFLILFTIREDRVMVLHVRHAARME